MNRVSKITVYAALLVTSVAQAAISLAECSSAASELNKNYPQRADKLSTITSSGCIPGPRRPVLLYTMKLDLQKSDVKPGTVKLIEETQLKSWCSDPNLVALLRELDVKYKYYDPSGTYVGGTSHTFEKCPR